MSTNKRLTPRKDWRGKVIFEDERGDPLIYVFSENISPSGIFLATEVPIQLGSKAFLSFTLPDGVEVRTVGEVVRIQRESTPGKAQEVSRLGMGIRFISLTNDQMARIQRFCLRAGVFDAG